MLHFFRKYQKIFFVFITIIIVISFAFFGTYQTFAPMFKQSSDTDAFETTTGKTIKQSYLNKLTAFLNSEAWMSHKHPLDSNFLNDGLLSKEFLETGIAEILAMHSAATFKEDLDQRLVREKKYTPYVHPYLPGIAATHIWSLFAPGISEGLEVLKSADDSISPEAFRARVQLFLSQKSFPPYMLGQVLRYQEKERSNGAYDPRLIRDNPALFGYHDLNSWFGNRFVEESAKSVINIAAIARKQGYKVSRQELLADILRTCQVTFDELKDKVELPVEDGRGLLHLYLRHNGLDEKTLLDMKEEIALFKRLMHEVGGAVAVDPLPLESFYHFAHENASIELYRMAPELRFKNAQDLIKFEAYVNAVGRNLEQDTGIALEYADIGKIEAYAPELIAKRYLLSVIEVKKPALLSKFGIKEVWDWECDPRNWEKLKQKFPELGSKSGTSFDILESLDHKKRKLVDAAAQDYIVSEHPEWITQALDNTPFKEKELLLNFKSKLPLPGITDASALIALLESQDAISEYTQDKVHYYRIAVQKRYDEKEVISFKQAMEEGLLDELSKSFDHEVKPEMLQNFFASFLAKYFDNPPSGSLAKQWKIEKQQQSITRSAPSFISIEEALALEPGSFSPISYAEEQGTYCYKFLGKQIDTTLPMNKMLELQAFLSKEARCHFFEKILKSNV